MNAVAADSGGAIDSRAARIAAARDMRLARGAVPAPGAREVRIRLEGCGVCASNLPVWEGRPWFNYPLAPGAPGHEGWGRIESVGGEVEDFAPGERVAFLSGRAYAEYDVAPVGSLVRLPAALDGQPFPGEPLGCAVNVFRRSGIEPGQTVAVVGAGFLGVVLTALAVRAGATVIALSRRPFARELAERHGARATLSTEDPQQAITEVRRLTGGEGCVRVIEAIGSQEALDLAGELCAIRARLVICGYHQAERGQAERGQAEPAGPGGEAVWHSRRSVDMQMWNWRGLDVVNAHERDPARYREGMEEAVGLVARGVLDLRPLITHRYPLADAQAAFIDLSERPAGFLKGLIHCT